MNPLLRALVKVAQHKAVRLFCFAYPGLWFASLYVLWVTAWLVLGHRPRYMLDDPKHISAVVDVPLMLTTLMIVLSPVAVAAALLLLALRRWGEPGSPEQRWGPWLRDVALLAACWIAAIGYFRWDPGGVVDWYFD